MVKFLFQNKKIPPLHLFTLSLSASYLERIGKLAVLPNNKRVQCEDRCLLNLETGQITLLMISVPEPDKAQVCVHIFGIC